MHFKALTIRFCNPPALCFAPSVCYFCLATFFETATQDTEDFTKKQCEFYNTLQFVIRKQETLHTS